ncbi:hypothetical protein ANN_04230 [Periplaneta americana]|uniref:Uncharacterized protein n=1 Tax=Periplaneta americana TaxID=6978 RepID=A0ABQ8T963_PERAM|nr:hypothetical protein ANN_04230 [Periplaneta americana]
MDLWLKQGFRFEYSILSYHIISYRIISYRIVSYRIVSYRIVSYRIVSYLLLQLEHYVELRIFTLLTRFRILPSPVEFVVLCEEKDDHIKDSFYEELEHTFDQLLRYHMKVLLGDSNAKVGREDIFKSTIGKESLHNSRGKVVWAGCLLRGYLARYNQTDRLDTATCTHTLLSTDVDIRTDHVRYTLRYLHCFSFLSPSLRQRTEWNTFINHMLEKGMGGGSEEEEEEEEDDDDDDDYDDDDADHKFVLKSHSLE